MTSKGLNLALLRWGAGCGLLAIGCSAAPAPAPPPRPQAPTPAATTATTATPTPIATASAAPTPPPPAPAPEPPKDGPIATDLKAPRAIVVDGATLYFLTEGAVMKLDVDGRGPAAEVAKLTDGGEDLAQDANNLYWVSGVGVQAVSKAGGSVRVAAEPIEIPTNDGGKTAVTPGAGLGVNDTGYYWGFFAPRMARFTAGIVHSPRFGDAKVLTPAFSPNAIAVDATHVYVAAAGAGVARIAKSGGAAASFAKAPKGADAIALDDTNVYFTSASAGSIHKVPKAGGAPTTLASGEKSPRAIAAGGGHVCWISAAEGTVRCLPMSGGTVKTVASPVSAPRSKPSLAIVGSAVIWTDDRLGAISRASLTAPSAGASPSLANAEAAVAAEERGKSEERARSLKQSAVWDGCRADPQACTRQCDGGSAEHCRGLANALRYPPAPNDGHGATEAPPAEAGALRRARDAYARACKLDGETTCPAAASMDDQARQCAGVTDCKRFCAASFEPACVRVADLAEATYEGRGVAANPVLGLELFELACAHGQARSCNAAGFVFGKGVVVKRNLERAAALFKKACDAGDTSACENQSGVECVRRVRSAANRRPALDPYCNPKGNRPARPGEPMPYSAYSTLDGSSDDGCFTTMRADGCTQANIATQKTSVYCCR